MISIWLDTEGETRIRWAKTDEEIIAVAQAYVTYEASLPPAQRIATPSLEFMQTHLAQAVGWIEQAEENEALRAAAAARYHQAYNQVRPLLDKVILHLKSQYADNLADLEQWGLATVTKNERVRVRKPINPLDWVAFLRQYVQKEGELPASERIADPSYEEMSALWHTIRDSQHARDEAQTKRESGVFNRRRQCQFLGKAVQIAIGAIIVTQYKGQVTPALQRWGVEVYVPAKKTSEVTKTSEV